MATHSIFSHTQEIPRFTRDDGFLFVILNAYVILNLHVILNAVKDLPSSGTALDFQPQPGDPSLHSG
ncbi:hypothetical protein [Legionella quateirensis]|uniref:hypothetical protein n=1 Tax=Legionella quateirensis TaxID=45072 RepID=UPI0011C05169|nr:hypothetical protein [Legionella quateirensis]